MFALYGQLPVFSLPIIPLQLGGVFVGRSSDCDVVVKHDSVSRRHAEILVVESRLVIRDLNSKNGTFVDNEKIHESLILTGQQVRFGHVSFLLSSTSLDANEDNSEMETALCSIAEMILGPDAKKLSLKQRAIVQLLLEGLSEKKIALRLYVSRFTVHNHIQAVYRILNVHSRSELLARFLSARPT
jgi:DNA-binding NarL/FixJ family response regulator